MGAYDALDGDMKQAVDQVTNFMREDAGKFCRFALLLQKKLSNLGTNVVWGAIDEMPVGSIIPNRAGMPGCTQLTREEWLLLHETAGKIAAILTPEVEQACNNAAGPFACVG